jgi:hypothetical protein
MPFRLRQHGTFQVICTPRGHPVFALYERKNETQKKMQYCSAEGSIADCISRID